MKMGYGHKAEITIRWMLRHEDHSFDVSLSLFYSQLPNLDTETYESLTDSLGLCLTSSYNLN